MRFAVLLGVVVTVSIVAMAGDRTAAAAKPSADAGKAPPVPTKIVPGEYTYEGGGGSLVIKAAGPGKHSFSIDTSGPTGHTCALSGTMSDGRADLEAGRGTCDITFTQSGSDVVVEGTAACSNYCGVRAWFAGKFIAPAPGCAGKEIAATRREAAALHKVKKHAAAADLLAPVLTQCANVLHPNERMWIRNDLAVAQGKAGRKADCRATLEPLRAFASATDKELRESNMPWEADILIPVARAARFNLKLCAE